MIKKILIIVFFQILSINIYAENINKIDDKLIEINIPIVNNKYIQNINNKEYNLKEFCFDNKCNELELKFNNNEINYGKFDKLIFKDNNIDNCNYSVIFNTEYQIRNKIQNFTYIDSVNTGFLMHNKLNEILLNNLKNKIKEETFFTILLSTISSKPEIFFKKINNKKIYKIKNINLGFNSYYLYSNEKLDELNIEISNNLESTQLIGKTNDGHNFYFDFTKIKYKKMKIKNIYLFTSDKSENFPNLYFSNNINNLKNNDPIINLPEPMKRRGEFLKSLVISSNCNLNKLNITFVKEYYKFIPDFINSIKINSSVYNNNIGVKQPILIINKNKIAFYDNKFIDHISKCDYSNNCQKFTVKNLSKYFIYSSNNVINEYSSNCNSTSFDSQTYHYSNLKRNCDFKISQNDYIVFYYYDESIYENIESRKFYDYFNTDNVYIREKIDINILSAKENNSYISIYNNNNYKYKLKFQFETCTIETETNEKNSIIKTDLNTSCGILKNLQIIPTKGILLIKSNTNYFYSTTLRNRIMSIPIFDKKNNLFFISEESYNNLITKLKKINLINGKLNELNNYRITALRYNINE